MQIFVQNVITAEYKTCRNCHEQKLLNQFSKNSSCLGGLASRCKSCLNKDAKLKRDSWNTEQKQQEINRKNKWVQQNRQKSSNWHIENHLKREYNLSLSDIAKLLLLQNNRCSICKNILDKPFVDHDHSNGLIRGLLCRGCNTGLGFFKDSIINLESAIKYLESNLSNDDLKKREWDTTSHSIS